MDTNKTSTETVPVVRTQSIINRSAVKAYALEVSRAKRNGKFTRVSEDFLTAVEAEVEAAIRQVAGTVDVGNLTVPDSDACMITGAAVSRIKDKLAHRALAIVQGKVMRHPSIGCTLKD